MKLIDKHGRQLDYLRISLTDRCNLNCSYCSPQKQYEKGNTNNVLSFEEMLRLIKIFVVDLNFNKIRFTGGEPLVRKNIMNFFERLADFKKEIPFELCLTTNGILLNENVEKLKKYGLDKINISIDSLNSERYFQITGSRSLENVLQAVERMENVGYNPIKINAVIMKGINDDEVFDFVNLVKKRNIVVRFIEYMPFSSNNWQSDLFISKDELLTRIRESYSTEIDSDCKPGVADEYKINGFKGRIGFISSISDHFCDDCNRLRITATGNLKLCLFSKSDSELSLSYLLRNSFFSDEAIAARIALHIQNKEKAHPSLEEIISLKDNNMLSIGG